MARPHTTFWLIPAEPLKGELQRIIGNLAREFNAPQFEPHVTLYAGPSTQAEATLAAAAVANAFAALELHAERLEQSAAFSKTFFVQFRESNSARLMFEMLRERATVPSTYAFNPHLSLMYKVIAESTRKALCLRSLVGLGLWRFDSIRAIEYEPPWSEDAARSYRSVAEHGLSKS